MYESNRADTRLAGAAPEPATDEDGADLRQLFVTVWRGKWAIAATAALFAGIAAAVLLRTPSIYEAGAKVILDTRDRAVTDIRQVVGDLAVDNAAVASEVAVLRSEPLIAETVARLSLHKLPAFSAPAPSWFDRFRAALAEVSPEAAAWLPPAAAPQPPVAAARQRLRAALDVRQEGRSYVIRIAVRAGAPALAAEIANAHAAAYVERQLSAKSAETGEASAWLNERLAALKGEMKIAEDAMEAFKAAQSPGEAQSAAVTEQQLAEINRELVAARAARAEAEARRGQIARLVSEKGRGAAADVLSSPLILTLRQQRAEAKRREAELSTRYGPKHPKIVNVRAELRDLSGAIGAEVSKMIAGLETDVEVALAREATLAAALGDLEDRAAELSQSAVGLRQLEREAEATRRIYENFLDRAKETTEAERIQRADARIVSPASPPHEPAAPKKTLIAGLAGVVGALSGLAFVFLGELMANTFRTGAEAQRALGLPLLAKLPRVRRVRTKRALLGALDRSPNSAFAEAARALRNALVLARIDAPPKVVMLTSAAPGEGKSSTCLVLAHMSAMMDKRAVVVDCDLRRPSVSSAADPEPGAGDLLSVLRGETALDEALRPLGAAGAWILPVSAPAPQAADILSSEAFAATIHDLTRRFDLVLLDTPPTLAVADAGAIGGVAEACVLLVRWNHTPRQAVAEAVRRLRDMGRPPTGVALTLVDPKREAAYEYGGYRAGAPDYGAYYATNR